MLLSVSSLDADLFRFLHVDLANSFFDRLMPVVREKTTWIPLYFIILVALSVQYRLRVFYILAVCLLTVLVTDQVASSVIKPAVERLRPCNNPDLDGIIRRVIECGPGFSFPSAHAANHFGLAIFFAALLPSQKKWIMPVGISWALLICFAQVYVGLHYPLDIAAGAVIGTVTGYLGGFLCRKFFLSAG